MEVRLAVLSDYAAVTDQGKLVIAGIFDTITAATVPSVHPRVSLALRIHLLPEESTEHNLSVRYVDSDGNVLLDFGGPIPAPPQVDSENGSNAQLVINFEPLPLQAYGRHAFEIFVDDEYVDAIALEIIQMNLSSQEPGTRH